jgi:predicted DNA-binding transcriptional regulator YafY
MKNLTMAISRSAYRRYKVIDAMLRNKSRTYPSLTDIQEACLDKLDMSPSRDTLEKDFRNMRLPEPDGFDAPIAYCRFNKGYHYTDSTFSINGARLTEKDVNSIKEALELLQNIGSSRVSDSFSYALDKILISCKEEFPEGDSKRKIIETESISGARGFEHFDTFFKACKNKTPVSFTHYSYQKRRFKAAIVHPVLLKEFDNFWYLLGYSESHKTLRTFGFDRIYEPMLLNRKFIPTPQEIVSNYYKDIYGVYPFKNQPKQEIVFFANPIISNYFEAYPIHESQVCEKTDYGYVFTLQLIPSMELIKLLRSYGPELGVLEPQWLDDEINNKEDENK